MKETAFLQYRRLPRGEGGERSEPDRVLAECKRMRQTRKASASFLLLTAVPKRRKRGSLARWGNAIKLSGRTFLAPHRGSCPKG